MSKVSDLLTRVGACSEACDWAMAYDDPDAAWAQCQRADWMLWLLGRLSGPPGSPSRLRVVALALDCSETAICFVRDKGIRDQVRYGIAIMRRHLETGDLSTLREGRRALRSVAADAAAYAAYAAYAYAAYAAADSADSAAAYAAAARSRALSRMADMVRVRFPTPPEISC